jgi:hypothetical protein
MVDQRTLSATACRLLSGAPTALAPVEVFEEYATNLEDGQRVSMNTVTGLDDFLGSRSFQMSALIRYHAICSTRGIR